VNNARLGGLLLNVVAKNQRIPPLFLYYLSLAYPVPGKAWQPPQPGCVNNAALGGLVKDVPLKILDVQNLNFPFASTLPVREKTSQRPLPVDRRSRSRRSLRDLARGYEPERQSAPRRVLVAQR
jgi:hypothetical protein